MILKTYSASIPKHYLFNGAGAVLAIVVVSYVARTHLFPDPIAECSARLENPMVFSMQGVDGGLLSPAELQARLAGRDWGVLENASVVKLKNGPAHLALQVSLPNRGKNPKQAAHETSGMGFPWLTAKLKSAVSVCLTYNVFVPENFEFGSGGSLPGLIGGRMRDREQEKVADQFSTRFHWMGDGRLEIRSFNAGARDGYSYSISMDPLHRGQWVRLEQEVVLNTPGESDGILRVWINGELKLEDTEVPLRALEETGFHGVSADIHYSDADLRWALGPKPTSVWVTPFELRWE